MLGLSRNVLPTFTGNWAAWKSIPLVGDFLPPSLSSFHIYWAPCLGGVLPRGDIYSTKIYSTKETNKAPEQEKLHKLGKASLQ